MAGIRELDYRNVCASGVPKMLTVEHKTAPTNVFAELLQRNVKYGIPSLSRLVAGDGPWKGSQGQTKGP
jgi:hypothetical protein